MALQSNTLPAMLALTALASLPRPTEDIGPPASFAEWGQPLRAVAGTAARTLTVKVDQPARWVLVAFVELGRSNTCSAMPYRGAFSDIAFR